jgi:hypothetical protein
MPFYSRGKVVHGRDKDGLCLVHCDCWFVVNVV